MYSGDVRGLGSGGRSEAACTRWTLVPRYQVTGCERKGQKGGEEEALLRRGGVAPTPGFEGPFGSSVCP